MKISVLGAGSWGTTLACVLADNGHDVSIWEFDKAVADQLKKIRIIPFIGGAKIPDNVLISNDLKIISSSEVILVVVPSHFKINFCSRKKFKNRFKR